EMQSAKKFLPTYGLWFDVRAKLKNPHAAELGSVRKILAEADRAEARGRLFLGERLDAGDAAQLEWIFRPARRGVLRLELEGVGSLFPFGFLKKRLGSNLCHEVTVWPAPVEYRRSGGAAARWSQTGERLARVGSGADLMALRRYEPGDSHRLIHWKASARLRRLLVRQFSAESAEGFSLWLQTSQELWPRAEQFELLVRFAATLAEDLFRASKLTGAVVNDEPLQAMRGLRDMEAFLDKLAVVERVAPGLPQGIFIAKKNVITFAPDGARGVAAYVDGAKTAAA
ncbi:MAG: DUF58 domain-containing protein, partial [Verrucomicrobiota bacterium]|nr:DUF58 domain-containing protein [Verrucomicrobiota bacterium]